MTVQSPYGTPPPPPPKKGLSPLAWIGIGCGALIVLCAIGLSMAGWFAARKIKEYGDNPAKAAELIVRANPDLEVVKTDEDAKTITVRDKKSGETMTLDMSEIAKGKIDMKSDKGSFKMDEKGITMTDEKGETATLSGAAGDKNVPDWVPMYPGGTAQGNYTATTNEGVGGMITVQTSDSVDKVAQYYEDKLKADGYTIQKATANDGAGNNTATVSGTTEGEKRTVGIVISNADGGAQALINYSEKK
ncbi:MAG TPA: hypothetical protein VHU81_14060 [Thermoanaerobaculia bacterium]|jgi:hypothetical protein|nr:hypothetical protein [Thermoanaerobaculia bacterium]